MEVKNKIYKCTIKATKTDFVLWEIAFRLQMRPYIKAYRLQGKHKLVIAINVGLAKTDKEQKNIEVYVRRFLLVFLQPYHVKVSALSQEHVDFYTHYHNSLFVRPDYWLKTFISLIDNIEKMYPTFKMNAYGK